ncbi:hypothetical protein K402DRAFT_388463 [Aulographum hederae CBS 113979]|uniref:Uncharacterized protein n=1 Tax=Aulographum hederae CBS 113979 TaxID=1176131 RepID=A0A6G1HG48_9PEZI|nr:hypothetical protein K402DRAFT_388463 [Aulographum hederae CBS 113979]
MKREASEALLFACVARGFMTMFRRLAQSLILREGVARVSTLLIVPSKLWEDPGKRIGFAGASRRAVLWWEVPGDMREGKPTILFEERDQFLELCRVGKGDDGDGVCRKGTESQNQPGEAQKGQAAARDMLLLVH